MKTAEEILKERGVLMIDFISSSAHGGVIEAIKEYGRQIVDRCAEVARTKDVGVTFPIEIVDTQSILKVKNELK